MRFAKHWVKAKAAAVGIQGSFPVEAYGWSNESESAARAMAEARASAAVEAFARGHDRKSYGYLDRPMREPVLSLLQGSPEAPEAVVTRNRYGAEVLNSDGALFIDVDLPEREAPPRPGLLARLFGGRSPEPAPQARDAERDLIERIEALVRNDASLGFRVYRTRGGFRCLATHAIFDAREGEAHRLMDLLGADPLYQQLCRAQQCFRARLTPKPWRVGVAVNPVLHPLELGSGKQDFERWLQRYEQARQGHATCELVATLGNPEFAPGLRLQIEVHDHATGCGSGLPLA